MQELLAIANRSHGRPPRTALQQLFKRQHQAYRRLPAGPLERLQTRREPCHHSRGAYEADFSSPHSAPYLFAWAVLYARHAMVGIARGQWWHAEYCISCVRDHALTLACLHLDLPTEHGKGFDQLPQDVRDSSVPALVRSLEREELLRALSVAVSVLLREADDADVTFANVRGQLSELAAASE